MGENKIKNDYLSVISIFKNNNFITPNEVSFNSLHYFHYSILKKKTWAFYPTHEAKRPPNYEFLNSVVIRILSHLKTLFIFSYTEGL